MPEQTAVASVARQHANANTNANAQHVHAPCAVVAFGAATSILAVASVYFLVLALRHRFDVKTRKEEEEDVHGKTEKRHDARYGITFLVCFVAFVSYFVMWFGQGHTRVGDGSGGEPSYLTAWTRYADWLITTPLLLLDLLWGVMGSSSARGYDVATVMALNVLMIATGWLAAFVMPRRHAWPRYVLWGLSTLCMLGVFAYLAFVFGEGGRGGMFENEEEKKRYARSLPWIYALWSAYPVVWLLSRDGLGRIGACAEVASYAVLDVLAKAGFGLFLLHA